MEHMNGMPSDVQLDAPTFTSRLVDTVQVYDHFSIDIKFRAVVGN
jgi:hypothetical protein